MGRWSLVLGLLAAAGCAEEVPEGLRPDAVLRDSLGLTDDDAVHVIRIEGSDGREHASPGRVRARPGDRLSFTTTDGRLHHVRFDTAAMSPELVQWLVEGGRVVGPPLLSRDSRWVVDLSGAPDGIYPFRLEGNGSPGGGVVDVNREPR